MEFNQNQPIYLQIVDKICDQVALGQLQSKSKLPSVRELAVELEVNPNTIVKSYALLEQEKIIYKQRGIGYFVEEKAKKLILKNKREIFIHKTLPSLFEEMHQLDISIDDIITYHAKNIQ